MDGLSLVQQLNRRQFLARSGLNLGAVALGSLLGNDFLRAGPAGGADQSGGLAGLPHFPPKAKRVIFLFQSGAPSQMDLFDYKPALKEKRGIELPDFGSHGPAHHDDDFRPEEPAGRAVHFQVRAARPEWNLAQRAFAAYGQYRRRILRHPIDADRGDQPRPGVTFVPDRLAIGRPAEHGRLGRVWPGEPESRFARVRRSGLTRQRQSQRPTALRSPLGERLLADHATRE